MKIANNNMLFSSATARPTGVLLLILLGLFIKPALHAQEIAVGTITITQNCRPGEKNGPDGRCYLEVKFHAEGGLSLQQAKDKCAVNGWVLATAQEVQVAWTQLGLDVYAYGMLEDGRFAVPVQTNHSNYAKGPNIDAVGGNQGFLYVLSSVAGRSYPAPSDDPAPGPNTIQEYYELNGVPIEFTNDDIANFKRLDAKYRNGMGNIMQDGWGNSDYLPVLDAALKKYIAIKFPYRDGNDSYLYDFLKAQIQDKNPDCADCKIARYEFVGFFVPEYLKMLQNGTNPKLRELFSEYVGYHLAKASRSTLDAWAYYSRSKTAALNEPYIPGEHFGSGPTLINPEDLEAVPYKPNTLSIFTQTAVPLPGKSVAEFKTCCMQGSPLYLSHEQEIILRDFMMPVAAHARPDVEGLNPEISAIPDYLYRNVVAEAYALQILTGVGSGAAVGGVALFGAAVLNATQLASHVLAGMPAVLVNEGVAIPKTFTIFSKELGKHALGQALGSAVGPVLVGVAVFAAGFAPTAGKAIEIAVFENNLKSDCYYKPQPQDWRTMSEEQKIVNFTFLFKMLVIDAPGLTYLIPTKKADLMDQYMIEKQAAAWASKNNPSKAAHYKQVLASAGTRYANRNVARGMPARQSSVYESKYASMAVDGNTDGNYFRNSLMCTNLDNNAWWEVDLGSTIEISAIRIFGRTDCCPERLNGFNIVVREEGGMHLYASNQPHPGFSGVTFEKPTRGRYVRIELPGRNHLSLAEVEVIGIPQALVQELGIPAGSQSSLVSRGKPARQSSVYEGKTANMAIDGNTDGNYFRNSLMCTNLEQSPWWEVDLGASYDISSVRIFPRTDCCPERLNGYNILVSETPFTGNAGGKVFAANQPFAGFNPATVEGKQRGRYVRIFLTGSNFLSMAEVEVYGRPVSFRIKNNWFQNHYIHHQNGEIAQGSIDMNWESAQWRIVTVSDGWAQIQSVANPNVFLHNQNVVLEAGTIQPNWWSAQWKLEPAHSGWVRIQNRWYKDRYIHNQNGKIEVGPIQSNWASALWKFE